MQAQAIRKNPPGSSELAALTVQLIDRLKEGLLIIVGGVSLFVLLALLSYSPADPGWSHTGATRGLSNSGGMAGAWLADLLLYLAGYVAYGAPVLIAFSGWLVFRCRAVPGPLEYVNFSLRCIGAITAVATACGLASLHLADSKALPHHAGGVIGDVMASFAKHTLGNSGSLILAVVFLAAVTVFTGISWLKFIDDVGRWTLLLANGVANFPWPRPSAVATPIVPAQGRTGTPLLRKIDPRAFLGRLKILQKQPTQSAAAPERREPFISAPNLTEQVSLPFEPVPREETPAMAGDGAVNATPPTGWGHSLFSPLLRSKLADAPRGCVKPPASKRASAPTELPPVRLLDSAKPQLGGYSPDSLETMSRLVEARLADFGVQVEVVTALPGPVITRFELLPAPGVKSSQISSLSKDLARSLSVISVRVVEVIPGKSVIGLEIPNQRREIVSLSEILNSPEYELCQSPLILALGKDISGRPIVVDLARMPHLLVAGTTGAGKSVGLNGMILSMLYKAQASQVRLIMIDPKMLELSIYEGIPHLLAPVVTDMKEAANALRWCVGEMERRYRLMASLGVRNLAGYNAKVEASIRDGKPIPDPLFKPLDGMPAQERPTLEPMPFIVVIIDELADMMMVVGKKVEELIARLAQKARAAGVHLILATQRPSVDVITGLIKANIPCRIAFQVSSRVDSRTILDQMGAENLLGQGDMLYLPPGTGIPTRVHGAFVADHEVHAVAEYLKERGAPDYVNSILSGQSDEDTAGGFGQVALGFGGGDDEADPLYDEAVRIVTETRRASISGVQRRLKVGYNRAARMLETMERSGVVGGLQPNGFREVLAAAPPPD